MLARALGRWPLVVLALGALLAVARAQATDSAPPPLRAFFEQAEISRARLSPSGRWLAVALRAQTGRVALGVADLDGRDPVSVVAHFSKQDVRSFQWVNDEYLVFNTVDLLSGGGDQRWGPGLWSARRDGASLRALVRPLSRFVREREGPGAPPLEPDHGLLWVPRTGGDEVIVGHYRFDAHGDLDGVTPKRVNVVTGRSSPLLESVPDRALGWLFDRQGVPRTAWRRSAGKVEVLWRTQEGAWQSIARFPIHEATLDPLAVDGTGQLFVLASGPGTTVLKRFDFAAGAVEKEALVSAPGFDFDGELVMDGESGRVLGVRVTTDAESTVWFDAGMKALQAVADRRFPDRINRLSCERCSGDGRVLVYSYSDQDPGTYWLYRPATEAWQRIGAVRPAMVPEQMARLDLHRIRARDGETLPVWVTLPPGKAAAPPPAIVLVHGGPWLRGHRWTWDADAQFLASRGYAVIEPEFRGSTGYGYAHFRKGWKAWGGAMQDDVADAARWAVGQGMADPKRICIAGASYGGYATLMGLVRYPDLYRCGVAWVAVTDPRLLFATDWISRDISREAALYSLPVLLGDPQKDADLLREAAPVERAGEIKAPVLLAFGGEDERVPLEHGTRMRAALRAAGQDPEWVVYGDEGHGWLKAENRIDFWERVERFLGRQLQPGR